MPKNQQPMPKTINKYEFYFEIPLYNIIDPTTLEEGIFKGEVDAYSSKNGIETTYSIYTRPVDGEYESSFPGYYKITLTCKRKGNDDVLSFFVYNKDQAVIKVGQYPSLADIQFAEMGKKYDKLLGKESLKALKMAIGIAAHGAGAGSFVYLRRIFEKLVFETFEAHKKALSLQKKDFIILRMDEKISVLRDYLPSQLIEMKDIYGILSKGVHELEEQECLDYFPVMKFSIELILDQKIEIENKSKKDREAKNQVKAIATKVKNLK